MPRPRNTVPTVRLHKPSGHAYLDYRCPVTDDRKSVSLGKWGSAEARAEHARLLAELAVGRPVPSACPTVSELCLAYLRFADGYYRKNGRPTNELPPLRTALRVLREAHAHLPADQFSPRALAAVRDRMVTLGWTRRSVNKQVARVRRVFRWAVAEMMVPASTLTALEAVAPLKAGRGAAKEKAKVTAVADEVVERTLPHLSSVVRAMVQLQRASGCRPGEVVRMRGMDLDRSADVWVYTPPAHKTEHLGRPRHVVLGPRAQAVLAPFLDRPAEAYLFDPRASVAELRERQRQERAARDGGSGGSRKKPAVSPRKAAGSRYSVNSYRWAVRRGCQKAGVAAWHPNQLRHAAAAEMAERCDLERARAALGHAQPAMTQHYARSADGKLAADVARRIG